MQIIIQIHRWLQWLVLGSGLLAMGQQIGYLLTRFRLRKFNRWPLLGFLRILEIQTAIGGILVIMYIFSGKSEIRLLLHALIGLIPVALVHWLSNQQDTWSGSPRYRNTLLSTVGILLVALGTVLILPEEPLFTAEKKLTGHTESVRSLAYTPDGKSLASGSFDGTIRIWDMPDGSLRETIDAHEEAIRSIAFSPDGSLMASVSFDKLLDIWDANTLENLQTINAHQATINKILFSRDSKTVYTTSLDNRIRIWDVDTGELLKDIKNNHERGILSLAISPNLHLLASGGVDGTIRIYDLQGESTAYLGNQPNWVYDLAFSPDDRHLASASLNETVTIWDLTTSKIAAILDECHSAVQTLAYSSDGRWLAAGCGDSTIQIWDAKTYNWQSALEAHQRGVLSLAFSTDSSWLASGSADSTIILWKEGMP